MKEQIATQEMPYEKFFRKGADSLSDAELLALLLRTGSKKAQDERSLDKCPAVLLAEEVLALSRGEKKGLAGLCSLSPAELMQVKGIGQVKAVRICCMGEIARRIAMAERTLQPVFTDPAMTAAYYRPMFAGEDSCVEKAILLMLDSKGRLLREKLLSMGTVSATLVSPREIFIQALKYQAVNILLLHNHPSGDVQPSREDAATTKRLADLGEMMELALIDHIIVGEQQYFSFREAGLL